MPRSSPPPDDRRSGRGRRQRSHGLRDQHRVDFTGGSTSKSAVDLDGGALLPGDVIEFTLTFANNGSELGTVSLVDDIPAFLNNVTVATPLPEVAFAPPPAGTNGNGRLTVSNLQVPAGSSVQVVFTATVDGAAPDGATIQNVGALSVQRTRARTAT